MMRLSLDVLSSHSSLHLCQLLKQTRTVFLSALTQRSAAFRRLRRPSAASILKAPMHDLSVHRRAASAARSAPERTDDDHETREDDDARSTDSARLRRT